MAITGIVLSILAIIIAVLIWAFVYWIVDQVEDTVTDIYRRNDANSITTAIMDYASNNEGVLPKLTDITNQASDRTFDYADVVLGAYSQAELVEPGNAALVDSTSYYGAHSLTAADSLPNQANIHILIGYSCQSGESHNISQGAGSDKYNVSNFKAMSDKSFTLIYSLEDSSSPYRCINS